MVRQKRPKRLDTPRETLRNDDIARSRRGWRGLRGAVAGVGPLLLADGR
jgi:hypothetical protein